MDSMDARGMLTVLVGVRRRILSSGRRGMCELLDRISFAIQGQRFPCGIARGVRRIGSVLELGVC